MIPLPPSSSLDRSRAASDVYKRQIVESETILALTEYAAACLSASRKGAAEIAYCQLLFHAAFSSPDALVNLLALRQATLSGSKRPSRQASVADEISEIKPFTAVSYTHLRAHETVLDLVCRLLLDKKKHTHT